MLTLTQAPSRKWLRRVDGLSGLELTQDVPSAQSDGPHTRGDLRGLITIPTFDPVAQDLVPQRLLPDSSPSRAHPIATIPGCSPLPTVLGGSSASYGLCE